MLDQQIKVMGFAKEVGLVVGQDARQYPQLGRALGVAGQVAGVGGEGFQAERAQPLAEPTFQVAATRVLKHQPKLPAHQVEQALPFILRRHLRDSEAAPSGKGAVGLSRRTLSTSRRMINSCPVWAIPVT